MEIKRTAPGSVPIETGRPPQEPARKPGTEFSRALQSAGGAPSGAEAGEIRGALSQYRKADLNDPAKVDQMVQTSVGVLVDDCAQRVPGFGSHERQLLSGWLETDPVMRGKIQKYLEKVLE